MTLSFHHICKEGHEWYNAHPGARKCPVCNPPQVIQCEACGRDIVKIREGKRFCGESCKHKWQRDQRKDTDRDTHPGEGGQAREVRLRKQGEARIQARIEVIVARAIKNGTCYGAG